MEQQNFHCSFTTNVSAQEAINGISLVDEWWAKDFEGSSQNLDDVFTVRFGETFVTFKITELIPNTKAVWTVTNCYLPWINNKTEWTGTKVVFEISTENDATKIDFTHVGLIPKTECYNDCIKGWTEHVPGSLFKLLNEGKGQPQ